MTEKIVGPIKISIGVRAAESHFLDPFKLDRPAHLIFPDPEPVSGWQGAYARFADYAAK
jgi:hypothetical protein